MAWRHGRSNGFVCLFAHRSPYIPLCITSPHGSQYVIIQHITSWPEVDSGPYRNHNLCAIVLHLFRAKSWRRTPPSWPSKASPTSKLKSSSRLPATFSQQLAKCSWPTQHHRKCFIRLWGATLTTFPITTCTSQGFLVAGLLLTHVSYIHPCKKNKWGFH